MVLISLCLASSRDNWHRDEPTRERRFSDRDRNSFEDVPEWSKPDIMFEPDSGTFDATGAFCVAKVVYYK
jgi:hypothetical protein